MINPSVASVKYQPVSINHATNLNLKVRTTSANSVRTKREQRTNNARTAYEQRANYECELVRTTRELRANYERELTRELRDAPVCRLPLKYTNNLPVKNRAIRKEKRISRIKPKKTMKVPSRRLESRIEKRKVARLIGGPVVRQSACPLWCHLLVRVEPV